MRSTYRVGLLALLVAVVALATGCSNDSAAGGDADGISQAPPPADPAAEAESGAVVVESEAPFKAVEAIGMRLRWRASGTDLEVELGAPTTGWIAVGFKPRRAMQDANMLIGYVADGEAVVTDQFGTGPTTHDRDEELGGSSDVTVESGSEEAGVTTIRFTIPLDSGDEFDQSLSVGETVTVILAHGPDGADDTTTYHTDRAVIQITL